MDVSLVASLLSISVVLTAAVTGIVTQIMARRKASGRVRTSEADVLWQQAQDMRAMLLAEKTRAEEQRDRLIESYTTQILPALASIATLVQDMSSSLADGLAMIRALSHNSARR